MSYIENIRPQVYSENERISAIVDAFSITREIAKRYGSFGNTDHTLQVETVEWPDAPGSNHETFGLHYHAVEDHNIGEADLKQGDDVRQHIGNVIVRYTVNDMPFDIATITLSDVVGRDGAQLPTTDIKALTKDLERYQEILGTE
ncbi:MAG TPA: hypothetical protein VFI74_02675 [Candidatus Saccharimonadales bacterium]|nr:hypothetical protein [Candidatus Saccharimonadales bacterium]